ncbi:MAG: hypothetical protein HY782_26645, partial [Chloroflexi bacterium]|nr:hypothetical protein [Chloroflexota bacterium]
MERTSYNVSGCSRPSRSHAAHWLVVVLLLLTACSSDANPAAAGITVQWTTASEVNTAGFNLYRGERKEGPFTKINPQLIPASNDSLVGGKYRFQDANVTPGQTYYYQLEDVETGGATTRHGPIVITAPAA